MLWTLLGGESVREHMGSSLGALLSCAFKVRQVEWPLKAQTGEQVSSGLSEIYYRSHQRVGRRQDQQNDILCPQLRSLSPGVSLELMLR